MRLSQGRWHRRRVVTVVLIDRCCRRRRSLSGVGLKQGHLLRDGMSLLLVLLMLLHQIISSCSSSADFESYLRWRRAAARVILLLRSNVRETNGKSDVALVDTSKIHRELAHLEVEQQVDKTRL